MKLNTKQQAVLNHIKTATRSLVMANRLIAELNNSGKQFDFVNCPELSDKTSTLYNWARELEGRVYQKAQKDLKV